MQLIESHHFILDAEHHAIPVDGMTWAVWFEDIRNRRVAKTDIGGIHVSTIFLGLNHGFDPEQGVLLFETMIFDRSGLDGPSSAAPGTLWVRPVVADGETAVRESRSRSDLYARCATWQAAVEQHALAIGYVRERYAMLTEVAVEMEDEYESD